VSTRLAVFDLDGTLVDSDAALVAPFVALGVAPDDITFGHVLSEECERLGIDVDDYLDHYDEQGARPFPGVTEMLDRLERPDPSGPRRRWAVCSNKHPRLGRAELERFGWQPDVALFSDAFDGPKRLEPVLDALGMAADDIVFVGDTAHDRRCATEVGVPFGLAGWNPRSQPEPGDVVLRSPIEVLDLLRR
jgi:HAD superfamily hydrolase (TIGR01549 family)